MIRTITPNTSRATRGQCHSNWQRGDILIWALQASVVQPSLWKSIVADRD